MPKNERDYALGGIKPNKSIRYPQFRILDVLDKKMKCQEIDAAGAMHRFDDLGVCGVSFVKPNACPSRRGENHKEN